MGTGKIKLKYVDHRPIYFPKLTYYQGGKALPSSDNILYVSESEYNQCMRYKNDGACFVKDNPRPEKIEKEVIKEVSNGSRE